MLTCPWKCTVLHCNHLGNTWKPLVLMTRHFDYCLSASECDNQSVRSSTPVVSRCFPGGYNVKLYISRGRLAWWLLAFLHSVKWDWLETNLICVISAIINIKGGYNTTISTITPWSPSVCLYNDSTVWVLFFCECWLTASLVCFRGCLTFSRCIFLLSVRNKLVDFEVLSLVNITRCPPWTRGTFIHY